MSILDQLDQARRELLHLGLRNPLINYRPLAARGVQVVDESPPAVYQLLVGQKQKLYFLEQADSKAVAGAIPQPSLPPDDKRYTDNKLQTAYSSAELQRRLQNSFYTARSYIEEQGVNILYVALGLLQWREREGAGEGVRHAPLVLVPVMLDRVDVQSRFFIQYTGMDIGTNLSLAAKLRLDFGVALPEVGQEAGEEAEGVDVAGYLARVAQVMQAAQPSWQVDHTAVSLGFFSFNKFFMYQDLDPNHWREAEPTLAILHNLLSPDGFLDPPTAVGEGRLIDQQLNLSQSHQIISADSSQLAALLDVRAGRNLVIQGPPGTGKSQTITNIMADALGRGQTILFVSEKMAALDVVKRRLDGLGLGEAALELHSHKTTKASLLAELGRVLNLGEPEAIPEVDIAALGQITQRLNEYAVALHQPLAESGLTPYEVYGRLAQGERVLADAPEGLAWLTGASIPLPPNWSQGWYEAQMGYVGQVQSWLGRMGVPANHPFAGCGRVTEGEITGGWLRERCTTTVSHLHTLQQTCAQLADSLGLPHPTTLAQAHSLHQTAQHLLSAPNLHSLNIPNPLWQSHAIPLRTGLAAGLESSIVRQTYEAWLIPDAWNQPVLEIRQALKQHGHKLWRWLIGEFRQAQSRLLGLCREGLPPDVATQLALVDGILAVQQQATAVQAIAPLLPTLAGVRWQGADLTDWAELTPAGEWLVNLHEGVARGEWPSAVLAYLAQGFTFERRQALRGEATAVAQAISQQKNLLHEQLLPRLALPANQFPNNLAAQRQTLQRWAEQADRWGEWQTWQTVLADEGHNRHTAPFVAWSAGWQNGATHLQPLFAHYWLGALLRSAGAGQYALWQFDTAVRQEEIAQFAQLDEAFLQQNRHKLAQQQWTNQPRYQSTAGRLGLLLHEIGKKRQHLPIRQLLRQTGDIIQRIKPIFMMSPLSIAMFLPPETVKFDLVIFDEASQVRPVDAFGAILRGKQLVVVGDSRQLPPTTFFDRVLGEGTAAAMINPNESEEGEDALEAEEISPSTGTLTGDNESILDLLVRQNAPQRLLRWHYRSRHESLIALSNRAFYGGELRLFPSPYPRRTGLGLHLRHLPQTVYERGGSRMNKGEATAVAEAIMHHAREFPHLTLGVAAFSSAQRQAIEDALELLRRAAEQYEPFFLHRHPTEPFFIKNLENVQGDERDVMLLSLGYGRDKGGRLSLNFGPLNQAGGERRLNVLITRARQQCIVFANFTADDLDLRQTNSEGLHALKSFLAYAALTPESTSLGLKDAVPATPFTQELARVLTEAGHGVAAQVGHDIQGVVVDLAVRDPQAYGQLRLGIMTDGLSYANAGSARERELIQPSVLAGLGWQVYRVWSTAWVRAWQAEAVRLLTAVDNSLTTQPTNQPISQPAQQPIPRAPNRDSLPPRRLPEYQPSQLSVSLYLRPGWQRLPNSYVLRSEHYHRFDPKFGLFTNDSDLLANLQAGREVIYPQHLGRHTELKGQVYGRLYYNLLDGSFCLREQVLLVTDTRYVYLVYDPIERAFYNGRKLHGSGEWEYGGYLYEAQSWYVRPWHVRYGAHQQEALREPQVYGGEDLTTAVCLEAAWVAQIVHDEGPIHAEELERALVRATGQTRRTTPLSRITQQAGQRAAAQGQVIYREPFYYPANQAQLPPITPRNRQGLPSGARKLEFVADEEIIAAIQLIVQDSYGILAADVPSQVSNLLGFGSLGTENQRRITDLLAQLLQENQLSLTAGDWIVGSPHEQTPGT
jgi:hypothetical protein